MKISNYTSYLILSLFLFACEKPAPQPTSQLPEEFDIEDERIKLTGGSKKTWYFQNAAIDGEYSREICNYFDYLEFRSDLIFKSHNGCNDSNIYKGWLLYMDESNEMKLQMTFGESKKIASIIELTENLLSYEVSDSGVTEKFKYQTYDAHVDSISMYTWHKQILLSGMDSSVWTYAGTRFNGELVLPDTNIERSSLTFIEFPSMFSEYNFDRDTTFTGDHWYISYATLPDFSLNLHYATKPNVSYNLEYLSADSFVYSEFDIPTGDYTETMYHK